MSLLTSSHRILILPRTLAYLFGPRLEWYKKAHGALTRILVSFLPSQFYSHSHSDIYLMEENCCGGSLGGQLVDVGDGVLRICTKTGCYVHDAATALAMGRGIHVEELVCYQKLKQTSAEQDACYLKYVSLCCPSTHSLLLSRSLYSLYSLY